MSKSARPSELRIALAMRGGVSLAVWMGGACREVARLRSREGLYGNLLEMAGYTDEVVVDVLAGTSAGGLNGVLLSQHIVCGSRFDAGVRNLWLQLGDLESLTRSPIEFAPRSLLRGDDVFYRRLRTAMANLAADDTSSDPKPRRALHPVRLMATATRLNGRSDAVFPAVGSPVRATSSRAFFRFRSAGLSDGPLNDFTAEGAADRLAYVGRTTSSFPGAFEPATPHVESPAAATPSGEAGDLPVNLYGVSSETGRSEKGFAGRVELIDGGVLDNIPLAWAIRSISGMPALQPVDRWLVYLQPLATTPSARVELATPHSPARLAKLLRAMFAVKSNSESILDDAKELREAAAAATSAESVLTMSIPTSVKGIQAAAKAAVPAYIRHVACAESTRLRALLTDPLSLVGPDPLPVPADNYPLERLMKSSESLIDDVAPLRAPSEQVQGLLILPPDAGLAEVGPASRTPLVAARTVTLLLHVVRHAELAMDSTDPEIAALRERLYGLRLATEVAVAARDRYLLRVTAPDPDRSQLQLLAHASSLVNSALPPVPVDTQPAWAKWASDLAGRVLSDELYSLPPCDPEGFTEYVYSAFWEALVDVALDLAGVLQQGVAALSPAGVALSNATDRGTVAKTLAALEILMGPLRPDPLLTPTCPRVAVASAANVSPLEYDIFGGSLDRRERVRRKLSGNQVANFAAFLSARWRANDWIWGRLDGAQTLVNLIAREGRLSGVTYEQAKQAFLAGATPEWEPFLKEEWSKYAEMAVHAPVDALALAATERIQWDILAEELPMLRLLAARETGRDRPPRQDELDETAACPLAGPAETRALLSVLGAVGDESVVELLPRADMRRALMRIALVGWRALLPAGRRGGVARWAFGLTVAPLLLIPALLAVVAPVAAIFSGLAVWGALSAVTGRAGSIAHLIPLVGIVAASAVWAWQRRALQKLRRPAGVISRLTYPPPLIVGCVVLLLGGAVLLRLWQRTVVLGPDIRFWTTVALAALAVVFPMLYVITETEFWGLVRHRRLAPGTGLRALGVIGCGLATGTCAGVIARITDDGPRLWSGLLVIHLSLLVTLVGFALLLSIPKPAPTTASLR